MLNAKEKDHSRFEIKYLIRFNFESFDINLKQSASHERKMKIMIINKNNH